VALLPRRASSSSGRSETGTGRRGEVGSRWYGVTAAAVTALVLVLAACGLDVQTNRPYTPADGVNLQAGTVQIRNLMILSRTQGQGYLSATMSSPERDTLIGISGTPIKPDGTDGAPLTGALPDPIALGNNVQVVLTDRPLIIVSSADLAPGLAATLTLTFSSAGQVTVRVPVVDANIPWYVTVSPTPSATASP